MKKLLIAALAATLCCTTSITGYGAIREDEVVSPQYENAKQPVCSILISGSTANVECNVTAKGTSVNSISGILTLQHKNTSASWDDVSIANWSKSTVMPKLTIFGTKTNLTKGTYRAKAVFTLSTNDGRSETITVYSEEKMIV